MSWADWDPTNPDNYKKFDVTNPDSQIRKNPAGVVHDYVVPVASGPYAPVVVTAQGVMDGRGGKAVARAAKGPSNAVVNAAGGDPARKKARGDKKDRNPNGYDTADEAYEKMLAFFDEAAAFNREVYQQNRKDTEPYRQLGDKGKAEVLRFMKNPTAYVTSDPGYKAEIEEGTRVLESAAAARGDFLGDGSKKRLVRMSSDVLSRRTDQAWGRIAALLGVGMNATGQGVSAALTSAGLGQQNANMGVGATQFTAGTYADYIRQAAAINAQARLQRSQNINDRQTAIINTTGNVAASLPTLFTPKQSQG